MASAATARRAGGARILSFSRPLRISTRPLRSFLRRLVPAPEAVYAALELIGLFLALLAAFAELWQWLSTPDASSSSAPTAEAAESGANGAPWAIWFWIWLLSILTDALGLVILIFVTAWHGAGGAHYEDAEYVAMLLLLFSSGVEVLGSILYQPLAFESVASWPQMLLFTRRHSWLLSTLVEFLGLVLLVLAYFPSFAEVMLGLDVWGLLLLAAGALLEVNVVNPHCQGVEAAPSLSGHTLDEYDWHSRWLQDNDFFSVGWDASGILEAVGMLMLIVAEVYEHAVLHGHNARETCCAVLCKPGAAGVYQQVFDSDAEGGAPEAGDCEGIELCELTGDRRYNGGRFGRRFTRYNTRELSEMLQMDLVPSPRA
eukprot:TRINITY_DN27117_c0_g2_i1.p1 TRINITY_DN27117_c0_g2~~TRINITY_DN27117_c0_g2_i1.p1  ORF type:complete len:372 (+),score=83.55 TRINITY_DN27117_c0_g2_i1:84-1199(+)